MEFQYRVNTPIDTDLFVELLHNSSLAQRRPVDDRQCLEGMIRHANLTVTAWRGEQLIGIARSMTDFHYACYLSDLAVHSDYQRRGIGKRLLSETQKQLGPRCKLILIAAPAANDYYDQIGFSNNPRCWVLERNGRIQG